MPHVLRDAQGRIDSVHRTAVPGSQFLPDQSPELVDLLGAHPRGDAGFADLDAGLIRVLEDLVDVLVARNVIRITDLPAGAQQKLFARKTFRDSFQRNALQLFGDVGATPASTQPIAKAAAHPGDRQTLGGAAFDSGMFPMPGG